VQRIAVILAVLAPAPASAQGIRLFGDARLGLGYNILSNGVLDAVSRTDAEGNPLPIDELEGEDELRGVSRIRFGVVMEGETASGITFGGIVRADHASAAEGGQVGQRAGMVYVAGALGSLSYGEMDGADENNVGQVEAVGLTSLGELEQVPYFTNAGGSGPDDGALTLDLNYLPSIRYDYDFAAFGFSVSTDRDLGALSVGASYSAELAEGGSRVRPRLLRRAGLPVHRRDRLPRRGAALGIDRRCLRRLRRPR
jgi:hypothetical protein